ncbi:MAG: hypothetical protein QM772_06515 [Ottowia sp.]|uniref:hypothetical protein n=1 Tax=Ottowia sp. TaxID=1898956 RepID=UPI0039E6584C
MSAALFMYSIIHTYARLRKFFSFINPAISKGRRRTGELRSLNLAWWSGEAGKASGVGRTVPDEGCGTKAIGAFIGLEGAARGDSARCREVARYATEMGLQPRTVNGARVWRRSAKRPRE